MNELSQEDKETVVEIVSNYVTSDMVNTHMKGEKVTIQFHGMPDSFGEILTELHNKSYSFTVDSAWEAPPKVRVESRDYYEEY